MLSFNWEQNEEFVIFGIAPERLDEVTKFVGKKPHKYVMGFWEGAMEPSCLMPLEVFLPDMDFYMKGEKCYLKLGPADARTNARNAYLVFNEKEGYSNTESPIGRFIQVDKKLEGEGFTFDPQTGNFYQVISNKVEANAR